MDRKSQNVADRLAIIDTVNRFGMWMDMGEWGPLRDLMADELWIDYSSLDGHDAERVGAEILIRSWRELITGFEAVQHVITNHCIDFQTRKRAVCQAHARVHHVLNSKTQGDNYWILGGIYTFGLEEIENHWKLIRITLKVTWSQGNPSLLPLAFAEGQKTLEKGLAAPDRHATLL